MRLFFATLCLCFLMAMCCLTAFQQRDNEVYVFTAAQLQQALQKAEPGQTILMAAGIYTGKFYIPEGINGTPTAPVTLKAKPGAVVVLQTGDTKSGYALQLKGNAYWLLQGFTLQQSKKGIVVDNSHHITLDSLTVTNVGEEGIHLRKYSSYNTVQHCTVTNTGLLTPGYGEGCYIGSAYSNWPEYTNNQPDTCNYNRIVYNHFGPGVAAESIDVKEGTKGGYIAYNTFDGTGMTGANYADSWMDIKGNNYLIEGNNGRHTLLDGYQVNIRWEGCGANNVFKYNTSSIGTKGYAIKVQTLNGTPNGNVVYSSNTAIDAGAGLTNIAVTPVVP